MSQFSDARRHLTYPSCLTFLFLSALIALPGVSPGLQAAGAYEERIFPLEIHDRQEASGGTGAVPLGSGESGIQGGSGGTGSQSEPEVPTPGGNGSMGADGLFSTEAPSEPWNDARSVVEAYRQAYPHKVEETAFLDGDWALRIGEQWFFHEGGRMLPREARPMRESYSPYSLYPYPAELPPLRELSSEDIESLEARVAERENSGIGRHPGLMDALWGITDRISSDSKTKTLYFFGIQVNVHRELLEDFARVEEQVRQEALRDPELAAYIQSIAQLAGHSWREISGTSNRSLHSYGIAVDILPRSYNRGQVYWLWARQLGMPWYSLDYSRRYMPPMSFIRIFEDAGFVWGGKWFHFDTIHFEYRPEILMLSGRPPLRPAW